MINVRDFIDVDGKRDVADDLQKIINENPNSTIFLPDGEYYISHSVITPADPRLSVSLKLDNYAKIIAADNWDGDGALVKMGGKDFANDIRTDGSNYYFEGGILDGAGVADGISIDGGRETVVRNVSIKHAHIGLHIKRGANNGSSDADIFGVNIIGNRAKDSIGVLVEGFDNTFTNMRIADVFTGVLLKSGGNMLRNIHPLFTLDFDNYEGSSGFVNDCENNWFDYCYSDNFSVGFLLGNVAILQNCFCFWYSPKGENHICIKSKCDFNSVVNMFTVGFCGYDARNIILEAEGGNGGIIRDLHIMDKTSANDDTYKKYLHGTLI